MHLPVVRSWLILIFVGAMLSSSLSAATMVHAARSHDGSIVLTVYCAGALTSSVTVDGCSPVPHSRKVSFE
jgi:hypothetical protein